MAESISEKVRVFNGIGYPITFRATPGTTAEGWASEEGDVLFSADLEVSDGISLSASGATPYVAMQRLALVIEAHARPFPGDSQQPWLEASKRALAEVAEPLPSKEPEK